MVISPDAFKTWKMRIFGRYRFIVWKRLALGRIKLKCWKEAQGHTQVCPCWFRSTGKHVKKLVLTADYPYYSCGVIETISWRSWDWEIMD